LRELPPLPEGISLRVWLETDLDVPVFESRGKWLHPLFELTEFLKSRPSVQPESLLLRDRIIGRAAAFLIVRLGIRRVSADLLSRRALSLLEPLGWEVMARTVVDRIGCQSEDLLEHELNVKNAWSLLVERRNLALAAVSPANS